eukprot:gnl/Hemi2/9938_TR3446_c0_g1_i1.p1 gnl/Hemi2/9938_TR3446_c0_g1~~gnl/Hemi2/9938_TR3446_c0_g1_i1.p1  ORF type:complete len:833 (-),score=277.98 gnl/Hemi2/9938_TR3446_c0_g1_i1:123-2621(-)
MSNRTYDKLWRDTQLELEYQLELDNDLTLANKQDSTQTGTLYIRYLDIYKKLEECYDQILHPQKLVLIRSCLDSTMGRVLEMKERLQWISNTDYVPLDEVLLDMKLTPQALEIPMPRYFLEEKSDAREGVERIMAAVQQSPVGIELPEDESQTMSIENAIRMIQANERGRQGRHRMRVLLDVRKGENLLNMIQNSEKKLDSASAALKIQKVFRGFYTRKQVRARVRAEELLLGLRPPESAGDEQLSPAALRAASTGQKRKLAQMQNKHEYREALVTLKEDVRAQEGPEMVEEMQEFQRKWYHHHREKTGKFPEYPTKEEGGSKVIFANPEWPNTAERIAEMEAKKKAKAAAAKKKQQGGAQSQQDKQKAQKEKEKARKKKAEEEALANAGPKISPFVKVASESVREFQDHWANREDIETNTTQKFDAQDIKDSARPVVREELRQEVDEKICAELDNFKLAKTGRAAKKRRPRKPKRPKRGPRDPTADRENDALFAELYSKRIIRKVDSSIHLSNFLGEYNVCASAYKYMEEPITPEPSYAQIRQLMAELGLYVGSPCVHQLFSPPIKACLLYGPKGCGKSLLVDALASELGATLFDLSPLNIAGKYPGKKTSLMMHLVFKLAKVYAPSIIFVNEIEKVFKKAGKRGEQPSRIKKELLAETKRLSVADRVIVIGCSNRPSDVKGKGSDAALVSFANFFQKLYYVPLPDHTTRKKLWLHFLKQAELWPVPSTVDVDALTRITEFYSPGTIKQVVEATLSKTRLEAIPRIPLKAEEFVTHLAKKDPVYKQDDEAMRAFMTLLNEQRAEKKAAQIELEAKAAQQQARNQKRPGAKK